MVTKRENKNKKNEDREQTLDLFTHIFPSNISPLALMCHFLCVTHTPATTKPRECMCVWGGGGGREGGEEEEGRGGRGRE